MKKILILLLAAVFVITTFVSCGQNTETRKNDDPMGRQDDTKAPTEAQKPTDGQGEDATQGGVITKPALSLDVILNYIETGSTELFEPHVLSLSEQQELRESVEKNGGTISFDGDGTVRITGQGQTSIVLHPDGTYTAVDEDGNEFSSGDLHEWPDDRFGNAVPTPEFPIQMVYSDEKGLDSLFENVTLDQIKDYAEKLKNAGYVQDSDVIDMPDFGMYSFSGNNGELRVEINYMDSQGTVTASLSVAPMAGSGEEPQIPTEPPVYTELDEEFAFLLADGTPGFAVIDNYGYTSIEPANENAGTYDQAKHFKALALNEGWTLQTETDVPDENGKHMYFCSVVSSTGSEIHIYCNEVEGSFYVDCISQSQGEEQPPVETQPWPTEEPVSLLPKPDFGDGFIVNNMYEEYISIVVVNGKYENFASYALSMQLAGFIYDGDFDEDPDAALYTAYNEAGYGAYVSFTAGQFVISITRAPESAD